MTRSDVKTLSWLGSLALLLALWWMLGANSCLDDVLGNRWHEWFPPPPAVEISPVDSDGIVVHNPYGIVACHHWPETRDHVITLLTIILFTSFIGFLAARCFEQRAVAWAGKLMGFALTVAFAVANFAFLPGLLRAGDVLGYKAAAIEVGLSLFSIFLGVLLSMLTAWLTLRWRPRG